MCLENRSDCYKIQPNMKCVVLYWNKKHASQIHATVLQLSKY